MICPLKALNLNSPNRKKWLKTFGKGIYNYHEPLECLRPLSLRTEKIPSYLISRCSVKTSPRVLAGVVAIFRVQNNFFFSGPLCFLDLWSFSLLLFLVSPVSKTPCVLLWKAASKKWCSVEATAFRFFCGQVSLLYCFRTVVTASLFIVESVSNSPIPLSIFLLHFYFLWNLKPI